MAARKVAYLTPLYFDDDSCIGGGERYPLNLAGGVADASGGAFEVEIVSYGNKPGRRPLRPGVGLTVLKPSGRPGHPLDVVSWDLPEAIADADLVHLHGAFTRSNEMGLLVAKQQRKRICITDHGGQSSSLGLNLGMLELADRVTCYSDFGAAQHRTSRPVSVVKGGVDGTQFTPPAVRPERDRVLYVGRLLPHKGIDQLIAALPRDLPLTVCGRPYSPPYFEKLQHDAAGKDVRFVTDADDAAILDLYRRAWVTVLPSVYHDCYGNTYVAPELMGFTLLESMACGTPAICSRVGAMPEFIRHGETGYVFDTLGELTGMLRRLAGDPGLVERMGRRARQVVEQEFDLKVVGARMAAIYREVLDQADGNKEVAA